MVFRHNEPRKRRNNDDGRQSQRVHSGEIGIKFSISPCTGVGKKFKKARQAIPKLARGIDERGQYAIYKAGRGLNTEIYYRSMTPDKTTEGQTTLNKKKKRRKTSRGHGSTCAIGG